MLFFPIVTLIYFLIPQKVKYIWLLFASYYFYMSWNPKYALLIATSTLITYLSGLLIHKTEDRVKKKLWVALSFVSNLGILAFFKYFDFILENLNRITSRVGIGVLEKPFDVLLPVGISFYTFQALSYTMDVYREELPPEKNFLKYALFVSFFPQLVAGPIERSKNLVTQISEEHHFDYERMVHGLGLMLWGFFLKVVVADRLAVVVNEVFNQFPKYQGLYVVVAAIFFGFQIYCDFGSYSNIAIGAAEVMGFSLMQNFKQPYLATNVADFWRRWHISLTGWFRDYLYIPLGGNRKGELRKNLNILIVFGLSGLWHGASWSFVVWGLLNGIFQVIGSYTKSTRDKLCKLLSIRTDNFSHRVFQTVVTFIFVDTAWIFFRADGMKKALIMIRSGLTVFNPWILFDGRLYTLGLDEKDFRVMLIGLIILIAVDILNEMGIEIRTFLAKQSILFRWIVYITAIVYILVVGVYGPGFAASDFIYFAF